MAEQLLSVRQLIVEARSPHGRSVQLVRGLDLDIEAGEILGLTGESGAGKSLTAQVLMGLTPPGMMVAGDSLIRWRGRELNGLAERQWRKLRGSQFALIPQNPMTALNPTRSIGSQMRYLLKLHRQTTGRMATEAAARALSRLAIPDAGRVLERYPHQLSGGMAQRALIAMAVLCRPKLLIADEVTSALDVTSQAAIVDQLTGVCRESGTALLMITHDLGLVARSCDRAAVMYFGRIVEQGPVDSLFGEPRHPYTAGLLAAIPGRADPSQTRLNSLAGQVPDVDWRPSGCSFAPRCNKAAERCIDREPENIKEDERSYRCFHPLLRSP
ncbi:MAG: ABC transporter ATP-binding protein [Wenzhouxiangella sp.]|jgi:peptide/nickel transport system ATP-binding protein|nr:ABC transporter ATP-binding protein [Wenzhouxiangella sp.]